MQASFNMQGIAQLQHALRASPKAVIRESQKVLVMTARQLAAAYAEATVPPASGGDKAADKFRARIASEQSRLYPTRNDHRAIYGMIHQTDENLAAAYWQAVQSGRTRVANRILLAAGLPQAQPSASESLSARTGRGRSVPKNAQPIGVAQANQLRRHIKERQSRVGLAKAGWLAAGLSLGGRIRQGGKERLPKYVRDLARKDPGLGGSWISQGRVVIRSNVRYAADALPPRLKLHAEAATREVLRKELKIRLQKIQDREMRKLQRSTRAA